MKMKQYIWYPILLVVVTVICMLIGVGIHVGIGPWSEKAAPVSAAAADFFPDGVPAAESLTGIHVNSRSLDITIHEGSAFGIEYSGDSRLRPSIDVQDGVLTVKQKGSGKHMFFGISDVDAAKLTVTLPENVTLKSVSGDMDAANVRLESIRLTDLNLSADAGNITVDHCAMLDGSIETDAGNLKMKDCTFEVLELDSNAGKIKMDGVTDFRRLKVSCDAGDVSLDADCDLSQYAWNLEKDLGTIKYNGADLGSRYQRDGSAGKIEISCDLGSIKITDNQKAI